MTMLRRTFLAACAGCTLTALATPGCSRTPASRSEILSALVLEVVKPETELVASETARFEESAQAFVKSPSEQTLSAVRAAFRPTLLAWKRSQCFRAGPMVETGALLRATFWPARPPGIEQTLAGTAELNETLVSELGADTRGLYAIEYLLFPANADAAASLAAFSGDAGARRRALLGVLVANVAAAAKQANEALADGKAFAERYAEASTANETVSLLLGQMISVLEMLAMHKLAGVVDLAESKLLKPANVEGAPSGTSQAMVQAQVEMSERLYLGGESGGIEALVRATSPAIADSVKQKYQAALAALRALDAPLERVVETKRPALVQAAAATRALEVSMKVELSNALGVTLTFPAGDGD